MNGLEPKAVHRIVSEKSVYNSTGTYSNKLSGGAYPGENRETPAADPGAPELLKKYGSIYRGYFEKLHLFYIDRIRERLHALILDT